MEVADRELSEKLSQENEEFRKIYTEHKGYKRQLEGLAKKGHRSAEEELEMARVKKLKLATKDKLESVLAKHR